MEAAAASKQCPNCSQALSKQSEGHQGDSCGSPVQMTRIGLRTATLIRTPDANGQRVPTRRATGQGTRSAVRNGSSISAEEYSSGSSMPEADQLPPDHADHLHVSQQQEAVSPVSRVPVRWYNENSVQQYINGIQLSPHRWVLVGDNISGASLYAVAGYDRGGTGDIHIMVSGNSPPFPRSHASRP
jgi:hypothetical protein